MNTCLTLNKSTLIEFLAAFIFLQAPIYAKANKLPAYNIPNTQVLPIKNSETGDQYELYIKLPEDYENNKENSYPVIYFTDAVWHIEILSAATEYLMKNAILVGISWQTDMNKKLLKEKGAHVSRYRDYSIRESSKPDIQAKYQLGQANSHLNFIRSDVIKTIERNYRTQPNQRTYFGYSLGGEFGAYTLLTEPDTFKSYIIGSPSINGDIPYLTKIASTVAIKKMSLNAKVFISYGSLETKLGINTEKYITVLKNLNDNSLSLTHEVIEGDHQAAFPTTAIRGVTWLSNLIKLANQTYSTTKTDEKK